MAASDRVGVNKWSSRAPTRTHRKATIQKVWRNCSELELGREGSGVEKWAMPKGIHLRTLNR